MKEIYTRHLFWSIWAILLALLAVTVALSYTHVGQFNTALAMGVAGVKAALIGAYFMRLRTSGRLVLVVAVGSAIWLVILFALTFSDYETRRYLPAPALWRAEGPP